jgi:hypothetical protein
VHDDRSILALAVLVMLAAELMGIGNNAPPPIKWPVPVNSGIY